MVERLLITEQEYRGLPMPSYSLLKKLDDHGPRSIGRKYTFESESVDFGSLLDCKLLTPEIFADKFYFESVDKPTGQALELANHLVNFCNENQLSLNDYINDPDEVLPFADQLSLFGSVKDPAKRKEKFDNDLFWNYLIAKQASKGKTVFTPDIEQECIQAEQIIRTHNKSSFLFQEEDDVEIITQLIIIAPINGTPVRGMLDIVKIDHKKKTITPYDLKATEYRQVNFPIQFRRMKYYLQGGVYTLLLKYFFKNLIASGYTVDNFCFLVYSRSDRYPFIWQMSDQWIIDAQDGFSDHEGYHKGVLALVGDYAFYMENNFFEVDRIIAENHYLLL